MNNAIHTADSLNATKLPDLQKIAKSLGALYGWYGKAPKAELVKYILEDQEMKSKASVSSAKPASKPRKITKVASTSDAGSNSGPATDGKTVTLSDLIESIKGLDGFKARRILRASTIVKPGKQWAWPVGSEGLAEVEAVLRKGVK